MSVFWSARISPQISKAPTTNISVNPPGIAFDNTLKRNFPSMRRWFGSKARNVEGIPIVNKLINVTCVGCKGYVTAKIIAKTDISKEKIFFTRNKLEERSMLLTTWRPSKTTSGIVEKSESNNTTCEACAVAWFPEAMAILQSASFMAKISLTPSPVIATVWSNFFNNNTNCFFCSGVTRPKTVYFSKASVWASIVVNVRAST